MNVETATNEFLSIIDKPTSALQTLFKRKQQQDLIIPDIKAKQEVAKQKRHLIHYREVLRELKLKINFRKHYINIERSKKKNIHLANQDNTKHEKDNKIE